MDADNNDHLTLLAMGKMSEYWGDAEGAHKAYTDLLALDDVDDMFYDERKFAAQRLVAMRSSNSRHLEEAVRTLQEQVKELQEAITALTPHASPAPCTMQKTDLPPHSEQA